jgi:subtilisin family serine protease
VWDPIAQVDLRGRDVSQLDLRDKGDVARLADFDSQTRWPDPAHMPPGFRPEEIMERAKNPGLGVRGLHSRGVTGRGVGIAIIDQALLVDHEEFRDRLRTYEEIHWPATAPHAVMHGPAVASIAVGKTVGVAPGADLYFIAEMHATSRGGRLEYELEPLAESIDRIRAIDAALPPGRKIRVISISAGWKPGMRGYEAAVKAADRAKAQGIFVLSVGVFATYPNVPSFLMGLGRDPARDPDSTTSFGPAGGFERLMARPELGYLNFLREKASRGMVLVPMDSRTTASPTGPHDYVFYRSGGASWTVPYLAGLYALACQVKPDITAEEFLTAASRTGDRLELPALEKQGIAAMIANPPRLIETLSAR